MRKIIVNSTALIALAKVNKLEILKGMYEYTSFPKLCTGKLRKRTISPRSA